MEKTRTPVACKRDRADLENLASDADDFLKATVGDMNQKATTALTRIAFALENSKTACAQLRELTLAKARIAAKKADTAIRQNPYESIGFAFAVGLLIGVLGSRK